MTRAQALPLAGKVRMAGQGTSNQPARHAGLRRNDGKKLGHSRLS
jgi:hypothetical protein